MSTTAFNYVTAEKAPLYRAVMGAFAAAKAHFVIHLRPEEVVERIGEQWLLEEVRAALESLVQWGNLFAQPDTGRVASVEEFYRARFLYHLTPEGEAAEAALVRFDELLGRRGALQAVALRDVRDSLEALLQLAGEESPDEGRVRAALLNLQRRFSDLAENAQRFMAEMGRTLDLRTIDRDAFIAYKEQVKEYIDRFIRDLVVLSADIAQRLTALEAAGVERLLAVVAAGEAEDFAPDPAEMAGRTLDALRGERREQLLAEWRAHWAGLAAWFLGTPDHPSQASVLRTRARAAINQLLDAVVRLNERRLGRGDRSADFRTLARWFLECEEEGDAHRLWRAAFGLSSCRHLRVDDDEVGRRERDPVPPATSWWQAPPLEVHPRLRTTGRYTRRGASNQVRSRGDGRAKLAERLARESEQAREARRRLATGESTTLSAIGELDQGAFRLLLQLLGEALSAARPPRAPGETPPPIRTVTGDGAVEIEMEALAEGSFAEIVTPGGVFAGRDYRVRFVDREAG
ncbi:TIGR02677 family protein [Endothiovibrio diazotrophicus]